MKPIDFEQSTKVLQKPGTLSDSQCGALPVWCDGKQCVSCWKPSIKERINILFGGSGSTLMACEMHHCNCFTMEIDPKYCDAIISRWENHTGEKAQLLNRN